MCVISGRLPRFIGREYNVKRVRWPKSELMEPKKMMAIPNRLQRKVIFSIVIFLFYMEASPSFSIAYNQDLIIDPSIEASDKNRTHSILKQGINSNDGNFLNNAASKKNQEALQYSLDRGGDVNEEHEGPPLSHEDKNDVGGRKSPLCLTVLNFLSSGKGFDTVKGSDEWVEFLLNQGANPNKICYGKYTPLMMVSGKGADQEGLAQWERLEMAMKIIVILIKNGADLNATVEGATAMDFATASNNLDLIMFLKSLGAAQ